MKRIIITESQKDELFRRLIREEEMYMIPNQIIMIKKYLDDNFIKATVNSVNDDGKPYTKEMVILVDKNKKPLKYMSDKDAFYLIQDEFKNIIQDKKERDKLLKDILIQWYGNKKSLEQGILSK